VVKPRRAERADQHSIAFAFSVPSAPSVVKLGEPCEPLTSTT
jgi:hypothetical protein